jgi:hypothetical protein
MVTTLQTISRIAHETAREQGTFDVLGVIPAEGDTYVEILLSVKQCHVEPCRVALGVLRDLPEEQLRQTIVQRLKTHIAVHLS